MAPRLEGPESPRSLRATVRHGESTHSRPPRGLPRSLAYRQPLYSLTDCFHAQRTNSQVFSSGCRCFPLFEAMRARPVCLATDELGCLFTTTSRAESRSGPGKGKAWRGTETVTIQQLRTESGAVAEKQLFGNGKGRNPIEAAGKVAQPTAPSRERYLAPHRARWSGRQEAAPRIPAGHPALCPAAARFNAGPPAGAFK